MKKEKERLQEKVFSLKEIRNNLPEVNGKIM